MRFSRSGFLALAGIATVAATPARADEAAEPIDGPTIIVTGTRDGYRTVETTSGTKTRTDTLNVPQTIDVVTEAQMNDQAIRSIGDLVRLIPGIAAGQGEGHRDQITLRGNNSTADFFVDGLRDDAQYYRSFYNIDRVEVHKGPNAMVFGRGGGGGIINRITKGAIIGKNAASITGSVDSFESAFGAVDSNFALNGMAAVRLNGFFESLGNHRNAYGGERMGINPVLGAEIGGVRTQIGYEYIRDNRVVDRGIPSAGPSSIAAPAGPLPGYRDAFFGNREANRARIEGHAVRLRAETDLTDTLTASTQGVYSDTDKDYANAYPATAPDTAGFVGIDAYRDITKRQSLIGQANLEWRGSTGGIEHILLLGAEYTKQDTYSERINGFFTNPTRGRTFIALSALSDIPLPLFTGSGIATSPSGSTNRQVDGALDQYSLYVQDQITLSPQWQVIAGLRYDRLSNTVFSRLANIKVRRVDKLWSPRAGLVFKPVPEASLYLSWARSFLPQSGDQFVTVDATNATLAPETFDNYELGAKWNVQPGLTLAMAIYRLDRGNTRAAGPTPGTIVQTGRQRTNGFEISLVGKLTDRWQTAMAYARTDAAIRSTTSAAPLGRTVGQVPHDQVSLWNRYDVTGQIGVGLGLIHQASQFATISNAVRIPAFTRADAALFVKLNDAFSMQMNVENLFNTTYFPAAHSDNNISTGAPRNARLTLTASF
jgi:catecholate siderophore receptor